MFREYKFIMYTPYNRACFVKNFYEAYNYIGFKGGVELAYPTLRRSSFTSFDFFQDLFNIKEYHSLVLLLCNDFPLSTMEDCERFFSEFFQTCEIQTRPLIKSGLYIFSLSRRPVLTRSL
jgi:hypothetical protein